MKKAKLFLIFLTMATLFAGICACNTTAVPAYEISLTTDKPFTVEIGDEIDYTQYFIVKDKNGNRIVVTEDMLDLRYADTSTFGSFTVTLTIGGISETATFIVIPKENKDDPDKPDTPDTPDTPTEPDELRAVFAKYADSATWNFADTMTTVYDGETFEDYYEYLGRNVANTYSSTDGYTYTDYLGYDAATDTYYFYYDNGDGTYEKYAENTYDFEENVAYMSIIDLSVLGDFAFTADGDKYVAKDPNETGNAVLGEYEDFTWVSFALYIADGKITKIVGVMDDGYIEEHALSKQGAVRFTLPDAKGDDNPTPPADVMEKQDYDPSTFDSDNLQDKMLKTDGAIGLPSTGNFHALVIPVQFVGDTITETQLAALNVAFNGNSNDTGWESVRSYYQKSSYGQLDLTFDIQPVYCAQYNSSYYAKYSRPAVQYGESYTQTGEEVILLEALAYYESRLDLTQYDTNGDGAIDAVYLIYSAPVDYYNADFYWAYVTWYLGEKMYDGLDAYYYLFAGFDFMDESTERDAGSGYDVIPSLKINAATFIHETGHLLGLDDYYDYDEKKGSNEGVGGADMMDFTVGDQNVYSKMMLGWLTPTIVNETATVTIESSQASASAILIPLSFNNSYFCEYLMIDLYTAQGLNALHASVSDSLLYDGAAYGVRIYHISSAVTNPYGDEYGSFTDNNNSVSKYALIKLVEADGEKKFASTKGYASRTDLWQAGDRLSRVFPSYTRNDGKKINFDITVNSVSAASASITVTFQ